MGGQGYTKKKHIYIYIYTSGTRAQDHTKGNQEEYIRTGLEGGRREGGDEGRGKRREGGGRREEVRREEGGGGDRKTLIITERG